MQLSGNVPEKCRQVATTWGPTLSIVALAPLTLLLGPVWVKGNLTQHVSCLYLLRFALGESHEVVPTEDLILDQHCKSADKVTFLIHLAAPRVNPWLAVLHSL